MRTNIPFFNIAAENALYAEKFAQELQLFMQSGQYILGDAVKDFEKEYATFCGTTHCVGTSNGLDALRLIFEGYKSLGILHQGDEVLVPAHTYIATTLAVIQAGLVPVFVEPEESSFLMDVAVAQHQLTEKTKACLVVHLYGELVNTKAFQSFAKRNNLLLIEDAAQAHGATASNGQKAGAFGDAAAFSFYPTKNIGALGDAGAVTTHDDDLVKAMRAIQNYGSSKKYQNDVLGFNMRLDALQARFLLHKIPEYPSAVQRRQEIAIRYVSEIENPKIILPVHPKNDSHVFHLFVARVEMRDDFIQHLTKNGVGSLIHYPTPPHKQTALKQYNHLSLAVTEHYHETVVSIPLYPSLYGKDVQYIIDVLNRY